MSEIISITDGKAFMAAEENALIRLLPTTEGQHALRVYKKDLVLLLWAIVKHGCCHLSGPTGTAKTSLIEALTRTKDNDNLKLLCKHLRIPFKHILLIAHEMCVFESPADLYISYTLRNGESKKEPSVIIRDLTKSHSLAEMYYVVFWIREIGRAHSTAVQGGLLNLLSKSKVEINIEDTTYFYDGSKIAWVADSNYASNQFHTLIPLDTAVHRRLNQRMKQEYFPESLEQDIVQDILEVEYALTVDSKILSYIIGAGNAIRQNQQEEGSLQSLAPPTIPDYIECYKMSQSGFFSIESILRSTLLGNALAEDLELVDTIIQSVLYPGKRRNAKYGILEDIM